MKKNKRTTVIIASACVIGLLLFSQWLHKEGNISEVNRIIPQSKEYSKEDITNAMDVVEDKFKRDFEDCTLTELWYDEEASTLSSDGWAKQYNADEAIVLLSNFYVGYSGADLGFNPNSTYTKWQWILVRYENHKMWELRTWGYG